MTATASSSRPRLNERDIWITARLCIKPHGDLAVLRASERADAFPDAVDIDGQRIWMRIKAAIEELQATEPSGPVH